MTGSQGFPLTKLMAVNTGLARLRRLWWYYSHYIIGPHSTISYSSSGLLLQNTHRVAWVVVSVGMLVHIMNEHTESLAKTVAPIQILFGAVGRVYPRNDQLHGSPDSQWVKQFFWVGRGHGARHSLGSPAKMFELIKMPFGVESSNHVIVLMCSFSNLREIESCSFWGFLCWIWKMALFNIWEMQNVQFNSKFMTAAILTLNLSASNNTHKHRLIWHHPLTSKIWLVTIPQIYA